MASWSGLPLPAVWSVPAQRNPSFWGRQDILDTLHTALASGQVPAGVRALVGLCGIGKTQIALEYIYRHARDYALIWWVRAAKPASRREDYVRLAQALGLPEQDNKGAVVVVEAVRRYLEQHRDWLLVFDNANSPEDLVPYLPRDHSGHVLITSRNPDWIPAAHAMSVLPFVPSEAVGYLLKRVGTKGQLTSQQWAEEQKVAGDLAEVLSGLPLALEQAIVYMETTHKSLASYLGLFRAQQDSILERSGPPKQSTPSVSAAFEDALQQARQASPAATDLASLCAFLAPADIPRQGLWQGIRAAQAPAGLVDQVVFNDAVMALRHVSLVEASGEGLLFDRLTQAVMHSRLVEQDRARWVEIALNVISAAFPNDAYALEKWPMGAQLLPHARAVAGYARQMHIAPDVLAKLYNQMGIYLQVNGAYSEAKAVLGYALAIDKRAHGLDDLVTARDAHHLASALHALGNLRGARKLCEIALRAAQRTLGASSVVATVANNLGCVLQEMGDLRGARVQYRRALALEHRGYSLGRLRAIAELLSFRRAWRAGRECYQVARADYRAARRQNQPMQRFGSRLRMPDIGLACRAVAHWWRGACTRLEHRIVYQQIENGRAYLKVANRYSNLGSVLGNPRDLGKAQAWLQRALAMAEIGYGPDHPAVAGVLSNLGGTWLELGNPMRARGCFERALKINENAYGPAHPAVANDCNNLACVLQSLHEPTLARSQILRAMAIDHRVFGAGHLVFAMDLNRLGMILQRLGDLQRAKAQFRKALDITQKARWKQAVRPLRASILNNLAHVLIELDDFSGAQTDLDQALAIISDMYGSQDARVASIYGTKGSIFLYLKQGQEALACFTRALEIDRKTNFLNPNQIALDYNNLGRAEDLLGNKVAARKHYERARSAAQKTSILSGRLGKRFWRKP